MSLKQYFKIEFKKPLLDERDQLKEERKGLLKKNIESCHSRLDSIRILKQEEKIEDAGIICNQLLLDIVNMILIFYGRSSINNVNQVLDVLKDIPENRIPYVFEEQKEFYKILPPEDITKKDIVSYIISAEKILNKINNILWETSKIELKTPLDDFRKKLKIQAISLGIIFLICISSIIIWKEINFNIKAGNVKIYLLREDYRRIEPYIIIRLPLNREPEWATYHFKLQKKEKFYGIRIDPVSQRGIRFQIRYIRLLDSRNNIMLEKIFLLSKKRIKEIASSISDVQNIKLGKRKDGKPLELISTRSNPSFHVKLRHVEDVSVIELSMRVIQKYKNFINN